MYKEHYCQWQLLAAWRQSCVWARLAAPRRHQRNGRAPCLLGSDGTRPILTYLSFKMPPSPSKCPFGSMLKVQNYFTDYFGVINKFQFERSVYFVPFTRYTFCKGWFGTTCIYAVYFKTEVTLATWWMGSRIVIIITS